MNNMNKALAAFVVVALALAMVPAANAQGAGGFGRVVTASTPDTTYVLSIATPATIPDTFCFVDTDGSTAFSPDEPVYLEAACGAGVAAGSVRIANPTTGAVGSQVTGNDADTTRTTGAMAHTVNFFDSNGDGRFSATGNDILYATAAAGAGATVAIGDIILSGANAGQVVTGTTGGQNNPVAAGAGVFSFFDVDNNGAFSLGDSLYYDGPGGGAANDDGFVSVGDVQLAAPSSGVAGGFGMVSTASDNQSVFTLTAGGPGAFCFVDTDGSTAFSPTEPVYLQAACGAGIAAGSVRIANPTTGSVGSQVTGNDADTTRTTLADFDGAGATCVAPCAAIMFFDSNGDGRFSAAGNDILYVNVDGAGAVAIGDIILSGANAGQVVSGSTGGQNNPLAAGAGTVSFFDADNNGGYSLGDGLYYDGPAGGAADGFANVGDVVLSAGGVSTTFGKVGTASDAFVVYTITAGGPAVFCFVDTDGSTAFSPDEPVYLQAACGAGIAAGSVRIANPTTGSVGSQVTGNDADTTRTTLGDFDGAGGPCAAPCGAIMFFDSNGDGRFSAAGNDILYVNVDGAGAVAIGDIILSGANAGQVVSGSTGGQNNPLAAGAGAVSFFDADNNGAYSLGDGLYYDGIGGGTADGFASIGDVQLSGAVPTGGFGGGTTPPTDPPTTDPDDDPDDPDDEPRTPGFELIALVAALGAALVLVRRRS